MHLDFRHTWTGIVKLVAERARILEPQSSEANMACVYFVQMRCVANRRPSSASSLAFVRAVFVLIPCCELWWRSPRGPSGPPAYSSGFWMVCAFTATTVVLGASSINTLLALPPHGNGHGHERGKVALFHFQPAFERMQFWLTRMPWVDLLLLQCGHFFEFKLRVWIVGCSRWWAQNGLAVLGCRGMPGKVEII